MIKIVGDDILFDNIVVAKFVTAKNISNTLKNSVKQYMSRIHEDIFSRGYREGYDDATIGKKMKR